MKIFENSWIPLFTIEMIDTVEIPQDPSWTAVVAAWIKGGRRQKVGKGGLLVNIPKKSTNMGNSKSDFEGNTNWKKFSLWSQLVF